MTRGPAMRRHPSLWRQIDAASRYAFPVGFLIFGLFVIGMPFGLPGQAELRPVYAMACVFFWSLYRPSSLPAPLVALTGLLLDMLCISPLGLWAVLLLILQGATLATRRRLVPQSFFFVWAVFSAFAASLAALAWAAQSILSLTILPALPLVVEMLFAIGLYPAFARFFIRAHRGPAAVELA
ncbi:MAG TPA: rod shape-determining protein MreD [Acidocella sp.]|nr:rod shape-determining protein MreD [Acidocella sp.]